MEFTGFSPRSFEFLMELAFNNNKEYFDAHRQEYIDHVREPMRRLNATLSKTVLAVDPELDVGHTALSRINRDIRFAKSGGPYHDYSWLMYRRPGARKSEYFGLFFSITPVNYSVGTGCYAPESGFMRGFRERIGRQPQRFYDLISAPELKRFSLSGKDLSRVPKDAERTAALYDGELTPYLTKKYLYLERSYSDLQSACSPDVADEIARDFLALAPFYRFIHGLGDE